MFELVTCNLAMLTIALLFYAWRDSVNRPRPSATVHERVAYMLWVAAHK